MLSAKYAVRLVAFTPDSRRLIAVLRGTDEQFLVWDVLSGRLLRSVVAPSCCSVLSPNREWIAAVTFDFQRLLFWSTVSGKGSSVFPKPGPNFTSTPQFLPDSRSLMVASVGGMVQRVAVPSGAALMDYGLPAKTTLWALSTDGKLLVISDGTATGLYVIASGQRLGTVSGAVAAVSFDWDGRSVLIEAPDGSVRAWNCQTFVIEKTTSRIPPSTFVGETYSADGRWLARPDGESVVLCDTQTKAVVRTLRGL